MSLSPPMYRGLSLRLTILLFRSVYRFIASRHTSRLMAPFGARCKSGSLLLNNSYRIPEDYGRWPYSIHIPPRWNHQ